MAKNDEEMEVKFLVHDLAEIESSLQALGGSLSAQRVFEINLRFDTADGTLAGAGRVLRLRRDTNAVMTFKGPSQPGAEVATRQEIEFQVSDFEAARRLLEALGYQIAVIYEKFRTTYRLDHLLVTLDEMPFGSFIEIEGPDPASIRVAATALKLDWEARSTASYLGIFKHLLEARSLNLQNLTFAELKGIQAAPEDLGLRFA
jgi:adenylate cyclase, class 2